MWVRGAPRRGRRNSASAVRAWLAVLGASWIFSIPLAADERLDAAVAGMQKRYAAVESISALFEQHYRAPGIDQSESGALWMKKPGLMRWEYRSPETKLFVADGKQTYLYTPEDRQVLVRAYSPSEMHSTPLQFLLGRGDIRKTFAAAWETELTPKMQQTLLIRLSPRSAEPEYAHVVLEIDQGSYDLRRMVIRERTNNISEFIFSNLSTNVRTSSRQFQFKIPKGVEVIRLDER
jgi:outer membrane lipoprotein carrier protein